MHTLGNLGSDPRPLLDKRSFDHARIKSRRSIRTANLDDEMAIPPAGYDAHKVKVIKPGVGQHCGKSQAVENLTGEPEHSMVRLATSGTQTAILELLNLRVEAITLADGTNH